MMQQGVKACRAETVCTHARQQRQSRMMWPDYQQGTTGGLTIALLKKIIVGGVCSVLGLCSAISLSPFDRDGEPLYAIVAVFFALAYYLWYSKLDKKFSLPLCVVSALFGILNSAGLSMHFNGALSFLSGDPIEIGKFSAYAMGSGMIFYTVGFFLFRAFDSGLFMRKNGQPRFMQNIARVYDKHTVILSFAIILLFWLPWLVAYFPGTVGWDSFAQLNMYFGLHEKGWSSHYPILSTYILGFCMQIGQYLGSDNLGIFTYVILQSLVCAYIYALIVASMGKLKVCRTLQLLALVFFAIIPMWGMYAQIAIKDTLFFGFFALYALQTIMLVYDRETYMNSWKQYMVYGVAALLVCLMRKNGVEIVFLTTLLVSATMLYQQRKQRQRLSYGYIGVLALTLVACFAFNSVLTQALNISEENKHEILSIPFQQTARYVMEYGDTVTDHERAAIDAILDYDSLAELYDPSVSDPVKSTYKVQWTDDEGQLLSDYFSVWWAMFMKQPRPYVEATLANTYAYFAFTPPVVSSTSDTPGTRWLSETETNTTVNAGNFEIDSPEGLAGLRTGMDEYLDAWTVSPVLRLFFSCAAYFWITVLVATYFIAQKKWTYLAALAPGLLTLGVCLLSPVNDYLRYMLPVAAITPAMLSLAVSAEQSARPDPTGNMTDEQDPTPSIRLCLTNNQTACDRLCGVVTKGTCMADALHPYPSRRPSVLDKKPSNASPISMSIRSAKTITHHMHSPSLCSNSDSSVSPAGQRPCWDMVSRPTNPASVRKASASSSTVHSFP